MRLVRYQLIAFIVVTVLGLTYAGAQYVGVGRMLGLGQYPVSVRMPATGGLYANAAVTEHGVTVGRVNGLHLTDQGVVADISLNNGTKIPSDLHAAVANTSAIGEQYLELTPKTSGGPYLTAGDVIPAREVSLPPSTATLLANLATLLGSVPRKQLTVTVNELYNAFNGTGPQLRRLLDSSSALLNAAQQNLTPTKQLISEASPVLATQASNAANIKAFSRNLNEFTTQLRASGKDLTGAIDQAPGFIRQLNDLIGQLQPTLPLLLSSLTSTGQVLRVYVPNLRAFLVIFPADVNNLTAIGLDTPVPGTINSHLLFQEDSPCETGYGSPTIRQPSDTAYKPPPATEPYCTVPHSSPQNVRGAHNFPCPNNPSLQAESAAGCGLDFSGAATAAAASAPAGSGTGGSGTGGTSSATYDPSNGLLIGPNGLLYSVGPGSLNGNAPTTLLGLLRQTLG